MDPLPLSPDFEPRRAPQQQQQPDKEEGLKEANINEENSDA